MVERKPRANRTRARWIASSGLVLCAAGLAVLWQSGVEFPIALPPGGENTEASSRSEIVYLLIVSLFVVLAPWRWVPVVAALFGVLTTVGFAVTTAGADNLFGGEGAGIAAAQGLQLIGGLTALVAGIAATWANYAKSGAALTSRS